MFDDIDSMDDIVSDNSLKMSRNREYAFYLHQNERLEEVRLRGSFTTGEHQELLIKLSSGLFVRISRTNGEDTFQIGAKEEGKSTNPMPDLKKKVPISKTCRDAFSAFGDCRRSYPRYDQADCHAFAQTVMSYLFPGENLNLPSIEMDDFM